MLTPKQRFIESRRPTDETEGNVTIPKTPSKKSDEQEVVLKKNDEIKVEYESKSGQSMTTTIKASYYERWAFSHEKLGHRIISITGPDNEEIYRYNPLPSSPPIDDNKIPGTKYDVQMERLNVIGVQTPEPPPRLKFEVALKYGLLEDISPSQYKYFEGGYEYLQNLKPREQKRLLQEYISSSEYQKYLETASGRSRYSVILQDIMSRNMMDTVNLFGYEFPFPKGRSLQAGGYGYWQSEPSERKLAKQRLGKYILFSRPGEEGFDVFEGLSYPTKLHRTIGETGVQWALFPIILPQMAVKYVTGEGAWFTPLFGTPIPFPNILGRGEKGKTLIVPDISKELEKRKVSPVVGGASIAIGEGLAFGRGMESPGYYETAKKYPFLTFAGTLSEFTGGWLGGIGYHYGKVTAIKTLGKIRTGMSWYLPKLEPYLPTYTTYLKYRPINLFRRVKYNVGSKVHSYIKLHNPARVFQESALPDKLSTMFGRTSIGRVYNTIRQFERTSYRYGAKKFKDITSPHEFGVFEEVNYYLRDNPNVRNVVFDLDRTIMRRFKGGNVLRPGTRSFLESLKDRGYNVGLWTHGTKRGVVSALKKSNIYNLFDNIITREDYAMNMGASSFKDISRIGGQLLVEDNPVVAGLTKRAGLDSMVVPRFSLKYLSVEERLVSGLKIVELGGEKGYIAVHASNVLWFKPFAWLRKGRESPGLSGAPLEFGNPRFLRLTGNPLTYETGGVSIFPRISAPTAPLFYFKDLRTIPESVLRKTYGLNRNAAYKVLNQYIKEQGSGVYIAPKMYLGGGEPEVIIRGLTKRLVERYYTDIGGVIVPLPEFSLMSLENIPKGVRNVFSRGGDVVRNVVGGSSVGGPPSISLGPSIISSAFIKPSGLGSFPSSSYDVDISIVGSSLKSSSISSPASSNFSVLKSSGVGSKSASVIKSPSSIVSKDVSSISSRKISSIVSYPVSYYSSYPSGPSVPSYPESPIPISRDYYDRSRQESGGYSDEGYGVKIKQRYIYSGKKRKPEVFVKVPIHALNYDDAQTLGSYLVDESTAKSYKIIKVNGTPKPLKLKVSDRSFKFYQKPDGQMIEQSLYAIDSPGELKGITWRGILANTGRSRKTETVGDPFKDILKELNSMINMKVVI